MTKHWPVAITIAFLLVLIASFMPWGTIRFHYTSQFMAYMGHPGLSNRILTDNDLSNLKLGTRLNLKGSAWRAGFDILGFYYPHFILTIVGFFLFASAISKFFEYFLINPSIPQILTLVHGANYGHGPGIQSTSTGRYGCSIWIAGAVQSDACTYMIPGPGERIFAGTQDNEMSFAIPYSKIDQLIDGLNYVSSKGAYRYPVPNLGILSEPRLPGKYYSIETPIGK